jgi:hypothetical protein
MPSFDVVSEIDSHELTNALDQAQRELGNRFDFRGVEFSIDQEGETLKITADAEFQVNQILDVVQNKMISRNIDVGCMDKGAPTASGKQVYMVVTIKQGLDSDSAKKMVKAIKAKKLKVQAAIQGDKIRVTGKKRDDLQGVMALLREQKINSLPLQFNNFRD